MRVVVIGGGISGLTAAYLASRAGHDVVCLESDAPGGLIQTERHDGFLCEVGPQAVLDNAPDTMALLIALNLDARALRANPAAARRFIYHQGRLHPLPSSPPALLKSSLLSWPGKLRLLREPFVARPDKPDEDETLGAFGARRLGEEATRTLLATFVIGVYAGAADELAIGALPRLAAMERNHGSLFRALMAGRKTGAPRPRSLSFTGGLADLPAALTRALGPRLGRGRATTIEPRPGGGWRVTVAPSTGGASPTAVQEEADAVVVATEAAGAAALLGPLVPEAKPLATIPTAPVAVCALGFRGATGPALGMDLDAYGFLVARGGPHKLLGCQYESSTFPGRARDGDVLLRCILGGTGPGFDPEVVERPEAQVVADTMRELKAITGLSRDPDFTRLWRHPAGIPQPRPGHRRLVAALDEGLRRHRGLHLLGQAVRGVGVNESIRAATTLAGTLS